MLENSVSQLVEPLSTLIKFELKYLNSLDIETCTYTWHVAKGFLEVIVFTCVFSASNFFNPLPYLIIPGARKPVVHITGNL